MTLYGKLARAEKAVARTQSEMQLIEDSDTHPAVKAKLLSRSRAKLRRQQENVEIIKVEIDILGQLDALDAE